MHELLLNNWWLTFITGKIVKWTCNFSSASEVFVDIHGAARCCPQSRHIGNLMGKQMVIAPYLTLVQEDTTITWCLIATLQGIKHLHQDEKRREQVSPKVDVSKWPWWVGWAAGQCSEMRGQEARMEEAGRRLRGRNIGAGVRSSGDSGRSPATPHTTQPGGRRRGL